MTESKPVYSFPNLTAWTCRLLGLPTKAPPQAQLPARALQIWQERHDLQNAFDISKARGRAGLFWWSLLHGFREMGFCFNEALDGGFHIANRGFPGLPHCSFVPVTWLMRALWARSSYRASSLKRPEEQFNCLAHYFAHDLHEANLAAFLTQEQADALREHDPVSGTPRLYGLIWHCAPELKERFDSPSSEEFAGWCRTEAVYQWPILAHPLISLSPSPKRERRKGKIQGVNLFGHALGRLGIGEDVRMAARSFDAAGIPHVIRNVEAVAAGQEEVLEGLWLSEDLPYDVNIFCMTGISTVTASNSEGPSLNQGRHNIGIWPWELPEWPLTWDQAWSCVDEVWATSRFTYDAYARAARVPVFHMPMAVVADATVGADRSDFGLPERTFLFGFSFDGLSSYARKNPRAVVAAFRCAFPPGERGVGLVLKGIRAKTGAPAWQALLREIGDDDRIYLINESLSRGQLLDLYRALDVFVSLHRSEGFGRNIAEAMLLGKPVIVSAHSGNMDFTHHDNSALIPTRLCEVGQGEYPFGTGQQWGDPDVEAAANAMRRMLEDRAWRVSLAERAQWYIKENYSPEAVAAAWAQRLNELA